MAGNLPFTVAQAKRQAVASVSSLNDYFCALWLIQPEATVQGAKPSKST